MQLEVSMAQLDPTTGDIDGNSKKIVERMRRAEKEEQDVIVFPEMAITGYCIMDMVENDQFIRENRAALQGIASKSGDTAAVVGFVESEGGKRYNAAAVLQDGEIQGVTRKNLLPNYRYFDDKRYFEPGQTIEPITIRAGDQELKLGLSICEDMWDSNYDRSPVKELERKGADVLININASPFESGKRERRHEIIQRHISETGLPFIYVNASGIGDVSDNVLVFDGDSLVYCSSGELIEKAGQFQEEVVETSLELEKDEYSDPDIETERKEKEIYEALVYAVSEYCKQTGLTKIVEPISGGIDSSLGLAICVEAVGPENVEAFNLPSEVNTEKTKTLAQKLADNLGVDYSEIPVESVYQEVLEKYRENYREIESETAKENVYARTRMMMTMLASNDLGDTLLVSNGNRTELALGYNTLYGDMAGGLNILGDLSKQEVYDIARYINERKGEEVIPEETFEIQPSAELKEGQVDPFDYATVSPLVDDLLQQRLGPSEIVELYKNRDLSNRYGGEESVYDKYSLEEFRDIVEDTFNRMKKSSFKRVQTPPIVTVSSRAFGKDYREPVLNGWCAGN